VTTFSRCEENWLNEPEYDSVSDDEITELEADMREEGCPKYIHKEDQYGVLKTVFCEGDFETEVTNNILICKKCGHKFDLREIILEREIDYRGNEDDI
jgi:hypothetical protein